MINEVVIAEEDRSKVIEECLKGNRVVVCSNCFHVLDIQKLMEYELGKREEVYLDREISKDKLKGKVVIRYGD